MDQQHKSAIFLDRDGVINEQLDFFEIGIPGKKILSIEDVRILPGVSRFIEKAKKEKYRIIVVTNQALVGRKLLTETGLNQINEFINKEVGNRIDAFYCCPHLKEDHCACRKPGTLLVEKAVKDWNIDLSQSWMIGDKTSDILLGEKMGMKTILVETGYGGRDAKHSVKPTFRAKDMDACTTIIFKRA